MDSKQFRNEHKYICSQGQLEILNARLQVLMRNDSHQAGDSYRVRSLYLDDNYDSALNENSAGVDNRRKFRIRVYNNPSYPINLEIKYKLRGMTHKDICTINRNTYDSIMLGQLPFQESMEQPLMQLYLQMSRRLMRPKIIIEYERTAFIYPYGNVRITFDRNISCSNEIEDFFCDCINLTPVLPKGMHVLEVKYDEFLPDFIAQTMELGDLQRTSFSKYYYGRHWKKGEAL